MGIKRAIPEGTYELSCPCGAKLAVKLKAGQATKACPRCRSKLTFVLTVDPRTHAPKAAIVVPPEAVVPPGEPAPAPPLPAPAAPPRRTAPCTQCGTTLEVDIEELTSITACPSCGSTYRTAITHDPRTNEKVTVLVLMKPEEVRKETRRTRAPSPRPGRRATSVPPPARRAAPPEAPPGTMPAVCPCGETFFVTRSDLEKETPCGSCGKTLFFREVRDPQSLAPSIHVEVVNG